MRRLQLSELFHYWQGHSRRDGVVDWVSDPDGLNNVCFPGAPAELNIYHARMQTKVFRDLLRYVPRAGTALDVGAGAGRWCRLLSDAEFRVTGIDLQAELIEGNRKRYPAGKFHCVSLQEFETEARFDLISSVTVLQHNPFAEQVVMLRKMRSLLNPGGYIILLENTLDQDPHVFSRSVSDWKALFESEGFSCERVQPYDYSPMLRLRRALLRALRPRNQGNVPAISSSSGRWLRDLSIRVPLQIDAWCEPFLMSQKLAIPSNHCGFLLRLR